jgi:hypothetical protein
MLEKFPVISGEAKETLKDFQGLMMKSILHGLNLVGVDV